MVSLMKKTLPVRATMHGALNVFSCVLMALAFALPLVAEERGTVKVGYYENEVFQEGAREGAMKTG